MNERFTLINDEAAPESGAAFILDQKKGLRVRVIRFKTLKQLDAYRTDQACLSVRKLPILLEAQPSSLSEKDVAGILNRMENWYYHTKLV